MVEVDVDVTVVVDVDVDVNLELQGLQSMAVPQYFGNILTTCLYKMSEVDRAGDRRRSKSMRISSTLALLASPILNAPNGLELALLPAFSYTVAASVSE